MKKIIFSIFGLRVLLLGIPIFCVCGTLPSWAAVVTKVVVLEKAGITTSSYPLTFGHVFKKSDVPKSVTVTLNGRILPTQFNIKRCWDDGSVKHGVLSVIIPRMPANGTVTLVLETNDDPNNKGAMDKAAVLATNVESRIDLTRLSGSGYSGNLSASLRSAIRNTWPLEYWLEGPVCTEILVGKQLNNSLHASWEVRFYPKTEFGVRVSHSIENMDADYRGNIHYAAAIFTGYDRLTGVYGKPTFQHNESSRWRKVIWIGPEPPEVEIHFDLSYLIGTGAVMNYDTSLHVPETVLAKAYSSWRTSNHDVMGHGSLQTYFPTTGGRQEIGMLPTWTVRYLLTMDNRMREIMLNNAEMSSSCSIHYRESDPSRSFFGFPVSIDDRPTVWTTASRASTFGNQEDPLPGAIGPTETKWSIDRAHQGSFAFVPYLITGDRYYLDEMLYWACWDLSACNYNPDWGRNFSKGLIRDQVRGEAWAIRNIADAAAFVPGDSPVKKYLTEKINNNIQQWAIDIKRYPLRWWDIDEYSYGRVTAALDDSVYRITAGWMNDFMTLALTHMLELNVADSRPILKEFSLFTINRFTNPEFNGYNGAAYQFPAELKDKSIVQTWGEANSKYVHQPDSFPSDDYAFSYRFVALAAISCLTEYSGGENAYRFLKKNINDQVKLNEDPTWAIIPRSSSGAAP